MWHGACRTGCQNGSAVEVRCASCAAISPYRLGGPHRLPRFDGDCFVPTIPPLHKRCKLSSDRCCVYSARLPSSPGYPGQLLVCMEAACCRRSTEPPWSFICHGGLVPSTSASLNWLSYTTLNYLTLGLITGLCCWVLYNWGPLKVTASTPARMPDRVPRWPFKLLPPVTARLLARP